MNPVFADFSFCVFDLETTGLDPGEGHKPIEIGGVRLEDGRVVDEFESFVDPGRSIPEEITSLTGIRDEDVRGASSPAGVLDRFLDFAGDDVLVAHNIDFDLEFLRAYAPGRIGNDTIDTLRMARKLLPVTSHSLDYLVKEYGLNREKGHRARDDAAATAELFDRLTERVTGYDDYGRCGIPERIKRNDLKLVLNTVDIAGRFGTLGEEFSTVRRLRNENEQDLADLASCSPEKIRALLCDVDRVVSDGSIELMPPIDLLNCYKIRYWSPVNWCLNLTGFAVLTTSLFTNRADTFWTLSWTGAVFLLVSPVVTYFRGSRFARVKQGLAGVLLFSLWVTLGYYFGVLEPGAVIAE